ncbi:MAG: formylglycine-generating enzyme family protein [Leptolyngbyaceae cyanobacterium]
MINIPASSELPDVRQKAEAQSNIRAIEDAMVAISATEDPVAQSKALIVVAYAYGQAGDLAKAAATLAEALTAAKGTENAYDQASALINIATAYTGLRDVESAAGVLAQTSTIAEAIDDRESKANVLQSIAQIERALLQGRSFLMGSPGSEAERSSAEGPQHSVDMPAFAMGRYPVTQAQWRFVAERLERVNRDLDPDPSSFKGDDRPVESVSWEDAVEFCDRLSVFLGIPCRLPSEAKWEYACRAGTTTPFHFGETITPELANYWTQESYGQGPIAEPRNETTPVGSYGVANAFGLYDMHGNVWEWCQDVWHENYEGAPDDGSAWIEGGNQTVRVLRGGSWNGYPWICRSAYRNYVDSGYRSSVIGFRVVFSPE